MTPKKLLHSFRTRHQADSGPNEALQPTAQRTQRR
jgi:hypothetical protein